MNNCVIFKYKGRFAHFLKAEANASAPTYPFPTRTILQGLTGAIMGLPKDSPQTLLKDANFAVSGQAETTHWHTANLRKDPPAPLAYTVKRSDNGTSKRQRNTIIKQEWLYKPDFTVWAQLSKEYHSYFENRIKNRRWHFSPSLGLSEMLADVEFIDSVKISTLDEQTHDVMTVIRKSLIEIDMQSVIDRRQAAIKFITMPRTVDEQRAFTHETYLFELTGKTIPVKTKHACKAGDNIIMWL